MTNVVKTAGLPKVKSTGERSTTGRIIWQKTPEKTKLETALRAAETGEHVVKVTVPSVDDGSGEVTIYRMGRKGMKHQILTDAELSMLGDLRKAFYIAIWDDNLVQWKLLRRTSNQPW